MRPVPPAIFEEPYPYVYVPGTGIWQWCIDNFLNEDSPLFNPDHMHLAEANVCFLWTNEPNASKGRSVIGQAEQLMFRCGKWQKGRQEQQIYEWFGSIPDFLITLDANYCLDCGDTEFLMLIEHEIYHCAQALDEYGNPAFHRDTGAPKFSLRSHDVEEFIGIVERYGVGNTDGSLAKLVNASKQKPSIASVEIAKCCGTCLA